MSWKRRTGAATLVAALVVLVGLGSSPATAASAWKDPIVPYPDLPSAQAHAWQEAARKAGVTGIDMNVKYSPGSIGWDEQQRVIHQYLTDKGYPPPSKVTGAAADAVKAGKVTTPPKTLTPPAALTRGAAGASILGSAFAAGWMITDGTLMLYGSVTGDDPLSGACAWDGFGQTVVTILYPLSSPDCSATVIQPNPDASSGTVLAYGGVSYTRGVIWSSFTQACWSPRTAPPSGVEVWGYSSITKTWAKQFGPGERPSYIARCSPTGVDGWATQADKEADARIQFRSTTGEVLATSSTLSADPSRVVDCKITWRDGSTSTATGGMYKEASGFSLGAVNSACDPAFLSKPGAGKSVMPSRIEVGSTRDGGPREVISDQTIPQLSPDEQAALGDESGKGLQLFKGSASCLTWAADCAGWWEATENGTSTATDYRCTYGGVDVALAQCYVYQRTFERSTLTPTITDPATGQQTDWKNTESPVNATDPALGPTPGDRCMSEWSTAPNPLEWVKYPVQCALLWAFAPRQTKVDTVFKEALSKWDGTMPGQITGLAVDAFTVPEMAGCSGLRIHVPLADIGAQWGWQDINIHALNACEEPAASWAMWARWIGAAVLVYMTALGVIRRASATVNAPGLGGGGAA